MREMCDSLRLKKIEVGVTFVNDKVISHLHNKYLQKKGPTDVLSFQLQSTPLIGDIVISLDTAKKQASSFKRSLRDQCVVLMAHGLLHLAGYDHQKNKEWKIMRLAEKKLLIKVLGYDASLCALKGDVA